MQIYDDKDALRFAVGPLMQEILNLTDTAARGSPDARAFVLMSGHDDGPMAPLLRAWNFTLARPRWPSCPDARNPE